MNTATITYDTIAPDKYALVTVTSIQSPGPTPAVSILRTDDQQFLSSDGHWSSTRSYITPEDVSWDETAHRLSFVLPLTMAVELDTISGYYLYIANYPPCPVSVPEQMVLPQLSRGGMASMDERVAEQKKAKAAEQAKAEAERKAREAQAAEEAARRMAEEQAAQERAMPPLPVKDDLRMPADPEQASSGKGKRIALVVLALIVLGAAACFLLLKGDKNAPAVPATEAPAEARAPATPSAPQTQAPAAAEPAAPAAASAPYQRSEPVSHARRLLREGSALPVLMEEADTMLKSAAAAQRGSAEASDLADGAFLLLGEAAEKGDARAMYLVGQFYDPMSLQIRGTIQPDPAQAASWYLKAKKAGNAQADQSLTALRTYLEQKAATGDRGAADALQRF